MITKTDICLKHVLDCRCQCSLDVQMYGDELCMPQKYVDRGDFTLHQWLSVTSDVMSENYLVNLSLLTETRSDPVCAYLWSGSEDSPGSVCCYGSRGTADHVSYYGNR